MHFRYKILLTNTILLCLAIGTAGYFIMKNSLQLTLDKQIENAVLENSLLLSSVEYNLISAQSTDIRLPEELIPSIGNLVFQGMSTPNTAIYIQYRDQMLYSNDTTELNTSLYQEIQPSNRRYLISKEDDHYFIYVTALTYLDGEDLYITTRSDISDTFELRDQEIAFYRMIVLLLLCICIPIIFAISKYITKPLDYINQVTGEFAEGNYQVRVRMKQKDEIGQLARKFNYMATAVSDHMNELHLMVKRREQFVADFTHEIKTPMTSIIGYADMIRSKELPREKQIIAANYIFSEGKRLEAISRKLFDLIYLNHVEITLQNIATVTLYKEIADSISPKLAESGLCLRLDVEPALIHGDKELLMTAFINLIDNARKASKPGDTIYFEGKCFSNGTYVCKVIDHGIGMSNEDVQKICNEFYMVDKSRSRQAGGAGLGMSLVSLIVSRHHAALSIISRPDEGTEMRITFPDYEEVSAS